MSTMINMRTDKDVECLQTMCRHLKKDGMTAVEVGTYRGQGAEIMLSSGVVSKIYCIDPWECGYDNGDLASSSDMNEVEKDFDNRLGSDERAVKLKGVLADYAEMLSDKNIDFVYIDGNHKYEFVKGDLKIVTDVIKPKVAVCGHDYGGWAGVTMAVNEAFGKPDETFDDGSWIKFVGNHTGEC